MKRILTPLSLFLSHSVKIEIVEQFLRMMVVENGGAVLLESAVDDMVSVIRHSLFPFIKDSIKAENEEGKKEQLMSIKNLDLVFNDFLKTGNVFDQFNSMIASSTKAHISTLHDTVQESLKNVVSGKLMDGLRDVIQLEDKEKVIAEMHGVRDTIPSAALAKMKSDWLTLSDTIRNAAADQAKRAFSEIRASFISSLNKISGANDSILSSLVEHLQHTVPLLLAAASDGGGSLLQDSHSLSIDKLEFSGSETVQDAAVARYIQEGKTQKFKTQDRKKCGGGGLFGWGRSCIHFTEATPYDQAVFSPNVNALRSAFDSVIQSWMNLYDGQVVSFLMIFPHQQEKLEELN